MASKFVQRHKKKTLPGALLLFLRKGKGIIPLLLIIVLISVPFIVPRSTLVRVPGVARFMNAIGMGPASQCSSCGQESSFSLLRSALEKAARRGREDSFWSSVFRSAASALPETKSSIALVIGGGEIAARHKVPVLISKTGSIKGVVDPDDKTARQGADGVYLGDIPGLDYAQADYAQGMGDMDVLGINAPYYPGSRAKPFPTGVDTEKVSASTILNKHEVVPVGPAIKARKMGRVSGFAWRNLSFGKHSHKINARIDDKGPLFRLAETFTMTAAAYEGGEYEYQATYVGATYDGTDVNADLLGTDAAVSFPDEGALSGAEGLLSDSAEELTELAEECTEAQEMHGAEMSRIADEMDQISGTFGSPPDCCQHGRISRWNGKVDTLMDLCRKMNVEAAQLRQACQGIENQQDCNEYSDMKIDPCSDFVCDWLWWLVMLFFFLLVGLILVFAGPIAALIFVLLVGAITALTLLQQGKLDETVDDSVVLEDKFFEDGDKTELAEDEAKKIRDDQAGDE